MYTAKVNGQNIDVGEISIRFRMKNPMFDEQGGMDWSATYPFTLPDTPRNRYIFGFPGRTNNVQRSVRDYPFEHHFNGIALPGNEIRVSISDNGNFECYVKIGRSKFISTFKDTLLTDLDFPVIQYQTGDAQGENYFWDGLNKSFPETLFSLCTIRNTGFFKETPYDDTWNNPTLNPSGPYQNMIYSVNNTFVFNHRCITPLPFLVAVMQQIFDQAQLNCTENPFSEDAELASLSIFNPNRIDFDPTYVPGQKNIRMSLRNHLPSITVPEFFIALRVAFGIDLYFNPSSNVVKVKTRDSIIKNQQVRDWQKNVFPGLKVYISDMIRDYRLAMVNDAADEYWAEKVPDPDLYIGYSINQYTEEGDLPATSTIGSLAYVFENDSIYEYAFDDEAGVNAWRIKSANLLANQAGTDPELTVEGNIGVLFQERHQYAGLNSPSSWYWATPCVDQPGNNGNQPLSGGLPYKDFALRLLFHRKYSFSSDNRVYVLGSSFNYDYWPHEINNAEYSLKWEGSNGVPFFTSKGLDYKFWAAWIEWRRRTQCIEFTKAMDENDIRQLDFTLKHYACNRVLILDEIDYTVTTRAIKPAKIKAWTV